MKVCLINNLYKPYERGGAVRMVEMTGESFKKMGHQVFVVSTKPISNSKLAEEKTQTLKCYYFRSFNFSSYYNLGRIPKFLRIFWHLLDMFDFSSYLKIKKILKNENPDLVLTNNLKGAGFLSPWLIKSLKIKHIHILHDIQLIHPSGLLMYGQEKKIKNFLNSAYIKINKYLFDSPSIIVSPSKWLLDEHIKYEFFPKSKKFVLPNPIEITSIEKKLNIKKERFKFIYLGQIEKHKGILFLIKTFKILSEGLEDQCELLIVGNGSKISTAKKMLSGAKNIYFKKWEDKNQGLNEMKKADCIIVPSLCYENSPTVIYEAASAGLPVIASELGGIPELIGLLGGLLFKAGNEGDLMYRMKWVMSNREKIKKIGAQSRIKIEEISKNNYSKSLLQIASNFKK